MPGLVVFVRLIAWLTIAVAAVALGASPQARASGLADSPWPMFQHDAQHTGRSPAVAPAKLGLEWRLAVEGTPGSPAIGPDGTIYLPVGQPNEDTRGFLYAINPDGSQRWRYEFPDQPGDPDGNALVPGFTTPAIADDGTIYVHTNSGADGSTPGYVIGGPTYLFALNPNGTKKWVYEIGSAFTGSTISSPAIGADGTIYFGSINAAFYALNPNGTIHWADGWIGSISSSPAIGADGTIYEHGPDGLVAYNPNGSRRWTTDLGGAFPVNGSPSVGPDGTIYACTTVIPDACHAVAPDGDVAWSFPLPGSPDWTPAIDPSGRILVTASEYGLYALRPDGTQSWRFHTGDLFTTPTGSAQVDAAGKTYVQEAIWGKGVFVVDPDGAQSDHISDAGVGRYAPDELNMAIGADGTVYVPQPNALAAYVERPDTQAPRLRLSGAKKQDLVAQRGVVVKVQCEDEACDVEAKGAVEGGSRYKLKPATSALEAGAKEKLKLKASSSVRRKIAHKLAGGAHLRAKVKARAADAAGNADEAKLKVRLSGS